MKQALKQAIRKWLWSGALAKVKREKPRVIAVTGTVGKTSTKEAIALVLAKTGQRVVKTAGNLGTDIGVPLSLLGFEEQPAGVGEWIKAMWWAMVPPIIKKKKHETLYYVMEYAADKPGDIAFLAKQIVPDVGLLTKITPAHTQSYPNFDDLIQEKSSLIKGVKSGGQAILNADDPTQRKLGLSQSHLLWYGMVSKPTREPGVWAHHLELTEKGWLCNIDYVVRQKMDSIGKKPQQSLQVQTKVVGLQHLYSLLAAAAVGFNEKVPTEAIKQALEEYQVPPGRGRLIEGQKDIVIVDDTYNSSPEAVKAGLDMLRDLAKGRRVVAVLGNMNELGDLTVQAHREVATYATTRVDYLIALGANGETMIKAAQAAGLQPMQTIAFHKTEQLVAKLDQMVQRRDLVYLKGSQNGVRLERVVKQLMAHPEESEHQLARQSAYWKHKI